MPHQISIHRSIEFSETDMAGLVHFSNYFRYVEIAEAELFKQCGYPLIRHTREFAEGWPRVRASCEYRAPIRFGDTIEVRLEVAELKIKAIKFKFRIYRLDADAEPVLAAKGGMTTVHTRLSNVGAPMESQSIPESLAAQIQPPEA